MPTGAKLTDVLKCAWMGGFTTRSDFARMNAELVAMAAVDGLITTKIATGLYGRVWLITQEGLKRLEVLEGWE